jgi:hypothetical protein
MSAGDRVSFVPCVRFGKKRYKFSLKARINNVQNPIEYFLHVSWLPWMERVLMVSSKHHALCSFGLTFKKALAAGCGKGSFK